MAKHVPSGPIDTSHFAVVAGPRPELADGEVLVSPLAISVDPLMRGRMSGLDTFYLSQFVPGEPISSDVVGRVVESRNPDFEIDDVVQGWMGWAEQAVWSPSDPLSQMFPLARVDPDVRELSHWLGVLGINGITAYFGILNVALPQPGETILISAAAGGVGSVAGQIAKMCGARVIGMAGRDDKLKVLTEQLGFDVAVNYRDADLAEKLRTLMPTGPDIYFDNVGGSLSQLVMSQMHRPGRIVECGQISSYDDEDGGWKVDVRPIHMHGLRFEGFQPGLFAHLWPGAVAQLRHWVSSGELIALETAHHGLDAGPEAMVGVLTGQNVGKMVVKLDASDS